MLIAKAIRKAIYQEKLAGDQSVAQSLILKLYWMQHEVLKAL